MPVALVRLVVPGRTGSTGYDGSGLRPPSVKPLYKKKHIMAKDVVGLLLGGVVSTKKNIIAKNVVGLLVEDGKNDREFD